MQIWACLACIQVYINITTAQATAIFTAVPAQKHVLQLQIPAGVVADRFGGVHVLLTGLLLWSTATGLNPLARYAAKPFYTLVAMRVFLGLAQSVMMPSVSATAAK